jgi:hypothetical protein
LWDYQAVPPEHPARKTGALHGYLNAGVLAMLGLTVLSRVRADMTDPTDGGRVDPGGAQRMLPWMALALLTASGWLGGEMVFKLGWRVSPAEVAEQLEASLQKRGDQAPIDDARATVQEYERSHALIP